MIWTQNYNPTGSELVSTLLAAAPIVVLLGALGLLGWSAARSAAAGLLAALLLAIGVYGMPWRLAVAATGLGAAFGLFPIGWIVLMAVFLYRLTAHTGAFDKVKYSVASLSPDRRLQALLIAFSFGAFLEGAAGFGVPVAISSALMIGAGFPPLYAAGLALLANTAPVAFGGLGTPLITLAEVTKLNEMSLSAMAGRQLPLFSLIIPVWMVWTMSGWRGVRGVWPALLVSGGVFSVIQFAVSNYFGPALVDVAGGLASLVSLAILLRFWRPAEIWRFAEEREEVAPAAAAPRYSRREVASAWVPWALLSACVFLWGTPQFRTLADGGKPTPPSASPSEDKSTLRWWEQPNALAGVTDFKLRVKYLHGAVLADTEILPGDDKPKAAEFRFNWLSATGGGIFVATLLSAAWLRISPRRFVAIFLETVLLLRTSLFTIAAMLAIAYLSKYSGADITLGLAFTHAGAAYPFFAAMLGWLGVALTGSDTASNALFGNLQRVTAERLGLNPILICAANSTGGVMGKMIDAQSIVVASVATGQRGGEGAILRFVFWHSLILAALVGLLTLVQAYLTPWMIPGP